jgi:hypothetical protein
MSDNRIHAPAVSVPLQATAFGALGEAAQPVTSISPLPVYGPRGLLTVTASFTRPADTTAYASGDLVANSTTTGSVVPIELIGAARADGEALRIERVRLRKSGASLTNAAFRVHLFRKPPTVTTGDNGVFSASGLLSLADIDGHVGSVEVTMDRPQRAARAGSGRRRSAPASPANPMGRPGPRRACGRWSRRGPPMRRHRAKPSS